LINTKFSYSTNSYDITQSKKALKDTDRFVIFEYESDKIEHLFSAGEILPHLTGDSRKEAKEFFIELCSNANVRGAPNFEELVKPVEEEAVPDYLELD
jgi:hypothetical protein